MEKLITRKEAAKILGISIATLDAARQNVGLSNILDRELDRRKPTERSHR